KQIRCIAGLACTTRAYGVGLASPPSVALSALLFLPPFLCFLPIALSSPPAAGAISSPPAFLPLVAPFSSPIAPPAIPVCPAALSFFAFLASFFSVVVSPVPVCAKTAIGNASATPNVNARIRFVFISVLSFHSPIAFVNACEVLNCSGHAHWLERKC